MLKQSGHAKSPSRRKGPTVATYLLALLVWLLSQPALDEQMQEFGPWQVHYVVIPTTFLLPEVAKQYGIVRSKDRALINLSLIHSADGPSGAEVSGSVTNLLSQRQPLNFREVREGEAVYYLADLKHTDRDLLRFDLQVQPPEGERLNVKLQQKMYADR